VLVLPDQIMAAVALARQVSRTARTTMAVLALPVSS